MLIRLQENYGLLVLLAFAVFSWWLVNLTGDKEFSRLDTVAHSPDYFSRGYVKWEMSESGKPRSKLLADQMTHYSDDKTTHMVRPLLYSYNEPMPPWVIQSDAGVLSADHKDLLLTGKVYVDRASAKGVRELKIFTHNLRVKPEIDYAETDEWAELLSLPNWTTGIGMKLFFVTPVRIELLANTKGLYATKK